jgi:hypothetical protein
MTEERGEGKHLQQSHPQLEDTLQDYLQEMRRTLSLEARGLYRDLLHLLWERNGPVPDNDLWVISKLRDIGCNVNRRTWTRVKNELLRAGKLISVHGEIDAALPHTYRAELEVMWHLAFGSDVHGRPQ